jgi:NAD(P)-dependent dehydrogenase (short-subunit alcohol dehydrogenase family)
MRNMSGKCGVIAGTGTGLGYGLALAVAKRGMNVVVADWNSAFAEQAAADARALGVRALAFPTDVSDPQAVERLAEASYREFGSVELVVNNAGVYRNGPLWQTPFQDWMWLTGINNGGTINAINSFIPRMMRQDGEQHFVITASTNGLWIMPNQGAYNATKYALVGLAEALADDLQQADASIAVSVICPGPMIGGSMGLLDRAPSLADTPAPAALDEATMPEKLREMMRTWPLMEPSDSGEMACRGIEQGEFYILTHAEGIEEIDARHRMLQNAFARRAEGYGDGSA